ncbi:hypothetical protein BKD02_01555 [Brucella sp. 09RB8910]|nr:hypothetical protein BKD02_01555 [Brucella sp. 09RB8910]
MRDTGWRDADGRSEYGPFDYKIFDIEDVLVEVRLKSSGETRDFSYLIRKQADASFDNFVVIFQGSLSSDFEFRVLGDRLHERSSDLFRGGSLKSNELEKETSKQAVVLQELRRDISQGALSIFTERVERIAADKLLSYGIAQEAGARKIGDSQLDAALAIEKNSREYGDLKLSAQLSSIIPDISQLTVRAEMAASHCEQTEKVVQDLVESAVSGFQGFIDGAAYDFGYITQPMTYFNRDFGSIADPAMT